MKKILMISSTSKRGGGPTHIFNLTNMLGNDFEFYFAMPETKDYVKLNKKNYIKISERKIKINDLIKIRNFIKRNKIDIVHSHGKGAGAIARLLRIFDKFTCIHTFHGIHLQCHGFHKRFLYIIYENILGRLDDFKIFVSAGEREYARKNYIFFGKKNCVIYNSVEDRIKKNNYINSNEFKIKNKIFKNKKINIISLCRLVEQKNPYEILNIASFLPECNFLILGDGDLSKLLNLSKIKKNLKNVFLLGSKKNVFEYLYASDIYLSTSLYEGFPISILEAMSIGLPIIASDVLGNNETIENSVEGFLYQKGNVIQAAKYIKKLIKNKKLMNSMITNSQLRQRKFFSNKSLKSKYLDLYNKFLS
jgi:glycosyltransferase involved in cell wall biosynthesis